MKREEQIDKVLSLLIGLGIIIAAVIGIYYSEGGNRFTVTNVYGDSVELYGKGLYAYNSVMTVANRLGADVTGILVAMTLIAIACWNSKKQFILIIKTSLLIYLTYHSACLVYGVSMNRLFLLYVACLGLGLYLSMKNVQKSLKEIVVPVQLRNKTLTGTGVFLIFSGIITAFLWLSVLVPAMIDNQFSALLGVLTTEATYGLDLSITCPILILSGIWLLKKKEVGYKVDPLLLNILVMVAVLVLFQRASCIKLGIAIPIGAFIAFIISFVILGVIAIILVIKLMLQLAKK